MKISELFEGYSVLPAIDTERYSEVPGLEGPYRHAKTGEILYYDPKEGKYYNRDSDMYVDYGLDESATTQPQYDEGEIVRDKMHKNARYVVQYVDGDVAVVKNFPGDGSEFEVALTRLEPLESSRQQRSQIVPVSSLIEIALAYATAYFDDMDPSDIWAEHIVPNFIRLYDQSDNLYSPEVNTAVSKFEWSNDLDDLLPIFDAYGVDIGFADWFSFLTDYIKQ